MACARWTFRALAILCEIVMLCFGIALLGFGAGFIVSAKAGSAITTAMCVMGGFIIVMNAVGICATRKYMRAVLMIYVILMCILILGEGTLAIMVFTQPDWLFGELESYDSTHQLEKLRNMMSSAGILLAVAGGVQIFSVIVILCFRSHITGNEQDEEDYWNKEMSEKEQLKRDKAVSDARDSLEERARKKIAKDAKSKKSFSKF